MQSLEVNDAVRPLQWSLGVKGLILKMKFVTPSLPRSSYVSSSFWFILQCLFWYSICVHPLYILQPLFLVLFYFLYYVLCSRFLSNTLILSFIQLCYPSKCLKNFISAASKRCSSLFFRKSCGLDNLPMELWKFGGTELKIHLLELFNKIIGVQT